MTVDIGFSHVRLAGLLYALFAIIFANEVLGQIIPSSEAISNLPPTRPSVKYNAVIERCKSQVYLYPPKEKICLGKACPKLGAGAPKLPPAGGFKCARKERITKFGVILLRPQNATKVGDIRSKIPVAWAPEFLAYQDEDQSTKEASTRHKLIRRELPNDFLLYSNHFLGELRPINRLMKLTDAEIVLVLPTAVRESSVRAEWISAAVAAFNQHESLAVIGMEGSEGSADQGALEFMHSVTLKQPVVLRRSAFLSVGMVDTSASCPVDGTAPELQSWLHFCQAIWRHGYSVAALDWEAKPDAPARAAVPVTLQKLWPEEGAPCPQNTSESSRGRQDCAHGPDIPPAAVIVQYFKRERNVARLGKTLRMVQGMPGVEVLVNDDSQSEHGQWMVSLKGAPNAWLVHAPNLHEIRGYNRLGKLASAPLVGFMQDDDHAKEPDWMLRAKELFDNHPTMALLGGRAGRLDTGPKMEVKGKRPIPGYTPGPLWQNDGPKYGWKYSKLKTMDKKTGIPFSFVYKVNASPLIAKRSVFLETGMYHPAMSCIGESGISFDFEYSVRMWKYGHKVGLYYSHFADFSNSRSSGTWASANATRKRLVTWRRNNLYLYYMYPNFHHKVATQLPVKANNDPDAIAPLGCGGKNLVHNRCPLSKSASRPWLFG